MWGDHRRGVVGDRMGFAWAPQNTTGMSSTDFAMQTGEILDRLAGAIHQSAELSSSDPGLGACGSAGEWCDPSVNVDNSWFNDAWKTFRYW